MFSIFKIYFISLLVLSYIQALLRESIHNKLCWAKDYGLVQIQICTNTNTNVGVISDFTKKKTNPPQNFFGNFWLKKYISLFWLSARVTGQESPKGAKDEVKRPPRLLEHNNNAFWRLDKSLKESTCSGYKRLFEVCLLSSDLTLGNVRDFMTCRWNGDSHTFRLNLPQSYDLRGSEWESSDLNICSDSSLRQAFALKMPPKQAY